MVHFLYQCITSRYDRLGMWSVQLNRNGYSSMNIDLLRINCPEDIFSHLSLVYMEYRENNTRGSLQTRLPCLNRTKRYKTRVLS